MENNAIDLEQYFQSFADSSAMAQVQSEAFKSIPAGVYTLQITKAEGRMSRLGFPMAHLTVSVLNEQGNRMGTVFTDVTWESAHDHRGLVPEFRKWEQLTRALYPSKSVSERAAIQVGQVLEDAKAFPIRGYVTERFSIPDGDGNKWVTPKTTEEANEYRKAGYKAFNNIANFSPLK